MIHGKSSKQKSNSDSSTEPELIGVHDCLPQMLWMNYFLEAKGHKVNDSVVHQDNKSMIFPEKNGKLSSSKRTKCVDIQHFLVTDEIKNE